MKQCLVHSNIASFFHNGTAFVKKASIMLMTSPKQEKRLLFQIQLLQYNVSPLLPPPPPPPKIIFIFCFVDKPESSSLNPGNRCCSITLILLVMQYAQFCRIKGSGSDLRAHYLSFFSKAIKPNKLYIIL